MIFGLLTQNSTFLIGPIAQFFGVVMNGIYEFFSATMGIQSLGLTIIVFTIFARLLMLPLAFKQQKSMKEMQKIQPELKEIQNKYKNKKDKENQQKMQLEMNELYQKHGVNPFGGCLPLLVQFPVIMGMFQVLRNVPAYIGSIQDVYQKVVDQVVTVDGYQDKLLALSERDELGSVVGLIKDFDPGVQTKIIDMLGKFGAEGWALFNEAFPSIQGSVAPLVNQINGINYMFGINLADKPDLMSIGVLIPLLNVAIQFLVSKSSMSSQGGQANQTSKTMMYTMPFITVIFVIQMPAGLGLYWLIGSLVQLAQQQVINKHIHQKE